MVNRTLVTNYLKDPLRRNSLFLIATAVSNALLGFVFWVLAARLYTESEIGVVSAAISASQMLAVFSGLGFGIGMIRFLPEEENKSLMINTVYTTTTIFAVFLVAVFVAGLGLWSPGLLEIRQDWLMMFFFFLFTISANLQVMQNDVFIAFRSAHYNLIQSLITGLRIPLLFVFMGLGKVGILSPFALGLFIAFIIANFLLRKTYHQYRQFPSINTQIIKKISGFSLGNYIGEGLKILPYLLFPMIIINVLNSEMSAYFYVAWMVALLFFQVAYCTNYSFLAEASYDQTSLRQQIIKVTRFIFPILVVAIVAVFFFGHQLLSLFGGSYSVEADVLVRILAISSLSVAINEIFIAIKRVEKNVKPIIFVYGFVALVTVIGGSLLLKSTGLNGIGYTWLAGNLAVSVIVLPIIVKTLRAKASESSGKRT